MAQPNVENDRAVERFIEEAVAGEVVWGIKTPRGFANRYGDDEDGFAAMLFWSKEADCTVAARQFEGGQATRIVLFDFLYRWLPNMTTDLFCAGLNWPMPQLAGASIPCGDLQDRIHGALAGQGRLTEYRARLQQEAGGG